MEALVYVLKTIAILRHDETKNIAQKSKTSKTSRQLFTTWRSARKREKNLSLDNVSRLMYKEWREIDGWFQLILQISRFWARSSGGELLYIC